MPPSFNALASRLHSTHLSPDIPSLAIGVAQAGEIV